MIEFIDSNINVIYSGLAIITAILLIVLAKDLSNENNKTRAFKIFIWVVTGTFCYLLGSSARSLF